MFEEYVKAPMTMTSISLSLSNISANLSTFWNCPAKDGLVQEISDTVATFVPGMLTLDGTALKDCDQYLKKKSIEAVRVRSYFGNKCDKNCESCTINK